MKTFVRLAVAGALIAGAQASYAQSANSTDLWLFVSDPSASVTFAEDTGISVNSLLPTSGDVANSVLGTNSASSAGSIDFAASPALTNFINTFGASNLEWAVLGTQSSAVKPNAAGSNIAIASAAPTAGNTSSISTMVVNNTLKTLTAGFLQDEGYLATGYTSGGESFAWSAGNPVAGNVWGAGGHGDNTGSTDLYGAGVLQDGNSLGTALSLYGITGNGGTGQVQSYDLTDTLTLTANGTLEVAPVPVPAAVWLFGSGLLGLIGVGRRRAA
jgi:hypothetical protein